MMTSDSLQIVFSHTGAGGLRHAASATGRKIPHLLFPEIICPHVGPLGSLGKPIERLDWTKDNAPDLYSILVYDEHTPDAEVKLVDKWQTYIAALKSWDGPTMIWFSKNDAIDRSLLLLLYHIMPRLEEASVVDISELGSKGNGVLSVGECNVEMLLDAERLARRLTPAELNRMDDAFEHHLANPKGMRLFRNQELIEVPVCYQDQLFLRHTDGDWQKASLVFGKVLSEGWYEGVRDRDYHFLLSRLHLLARTGQIEWRGRSTKKIFDENPLMGEIRQNFG